MSAVVVCCVPHESETGRHINNIFLNDLFYFLEGYVKQLMITVSQTLTMTSL